MYYELGGDVCGKIRRLGHEKEVVCIVSGGGEYVRRSGAWDTRMRLYVWGVCGEIGVGSRRIRGYVL